MKIYTKTGDGGETGILGGKRIKKSSAIVEAIGEVDELNASVGVLISLLDQDFSSAKDQLTMIQHELFVVGANLAAVQVADRLDNVPVLLESSVIQLEYWIDAMQAELALLRQFILPGGSVAGAQAFFTRAVCRRAERCVVCLLESFSMNPTLLQYLNRLSDYLFVLARFFNQKSGMLDVPWEK